MFGNNKFTGIYTYYFSKAIEGNLKVKNTEVVILLIIIGFMLLVEASSQRWYFSIPLLYQTNKKKEHWRR